MKHTPTLINLKFPFPENINIKILSFVMTKSKCVIRTLKIVKIKKWNIALCFLSHISHQINLMTKQNKTLHIVVLNLPKKVNLEHFLNKKYSLTNIKTKFIEMLTKKEICYVEVLLIDYNAMHIVEIQTLHSTAVIYWYPIVI